MRQKTRNNDWLRDYLIPTRLLCAFLLFATPIANSLSGCNATTEEQDSQNNNENQDCGVEDKDRDGVPDEEDNCPSVLVRS